MLRAVHGAEDDQREPVVATSTPVGRAVDVTGAGGAVTASGIHAASR